MFELESKHALITGGNSGIGLSVVEHFVAQGARVSVLDMAASASPEILALGDAVHYQQGDVTALGCTRDWVNTRNTNGGIDILFNNAAVFDMAPLLKSDEASFDRLFNVNVKAMFFTLQAVAQLMVEQGRLGRIINLASQAGRRGEALVSHYCATKAAVISYTQSAALALAQHQITVNAIAPGVIDTPMWKQVDRQFAEFEGLALGEKKVQVGKAVPLGRMGDARDVAEVATFLASDRASYVTGQTWNVDGGNVLS